jgi:predicted nucleic acid-binding Zn ribbon protein
MARRRRRGCDVKRGGPPEPVGAAVARFLRSHGHATRVEQASVIEDWARIVGPQIARATEAISISADGILVVGVSTNAWMAELAMHEREFLARLNEGSERPRVRRIRWQIRRESARP